MVIISMNGVGWNKGRTVDST